MSYSYLTLIEATEVRRGQFILFSVIGKGSAFKSDLCDSTLRMGARLGCGAQLFEVSKAHPSGLCVWVLAGVRCREGPQRLLRIYRRWCQMLPFVSCFWGGGKGKPVRLLKKGSAEKAACFRRLRWAGWAQARSGPGWGWEVWGVRAAAWPAVPVAAGREMAVFL